MQASDIAEVLKIVLPTMIAAGAGLFGFLKWIDVRRREIADQQFKRVFELLSIVSGQYPDGRGARIIDQIAAVWLLREFPAYGDTVRRALSGDWSSGMAAQNFLDHVAPEIEKCSRSSSLSSVHHSARRAH